MKFTEIQTDFLLNTNQIKITVKESGGLKLIFCPLGHWYHRGLPHKGLQGVIHLGLTTIWSTILRRLFAYSWQLYAKYIDQNLSLNFKGCIWKALLDGCFCRFNCFQEWCVISWWNIGVLQQLGRTLNSGFLGISEQYQLQLFLQFQLVDKIWKQKKAMGSVILSSSSHNTRNLFINIF